MMEPTQSIGLSPEATALRIETEELIADLQARRPELVAKSDERFPGKTASGVKTLAPALGKKRPER